MSKYLVLYRSPTSAREQMANATPEQAKAGMDAWMAWAGKAGSAVVDLGAPLGTGEAVGSDTADDEISYPDVDMHARLAPDGAYRFSTKSGEPL